MRRLCPAADLLLSLRGIIPNEIWANSSRPFIIDRFCGGGIYRDCDIFTFSFSGRFFGDPELGLDALGGKRITGQ